MLREIKLIGVNQTTSTEKTTWSFTRIWVYVEWMDLPNQNWRALERVADLSRAGRLWIYGQRCEDMSHPQDVWRVNSDPCRSKVIGPWIKRGRIRHDVAKNHCGTIAMNMGFTVVLVPTKDGSHWFCTKCINAISWPGNILAQWLPQYERADCLLPNTEYSQRPMLVQTTARSLLAMAIGIKRALPLIADCTDSFACA